MVAGAGGNVERDVIFRLKAEVDAKSFKALSRFGKLAAKTQIDIDKGVEQSAKKRLNIQEKATKSAQREREKAFRSEQQLLEKGAKLIQKRLDEQQKAVEKAAKAEVKARERASKQLEKRRLIFAKNREKGIKAERKAVDEATRQAEIFQKKGAAAAKRFNSELLKAGTSALQLARGLAFIGIASEKDLSKLVTALVRIQGTFDIIKGGVGIFKSIAAAQKALTASTQAATVAQLALNAAQKAGGVTGGAAAAGGAARAAGGVGAIGAAGGPAVVIGAAVAALVAGIALVNEDFRQVLGEFLGILESETERAKKALQQRIALDQREANFRSRRLALQTQERERETRIFSRQLRIQEARGQITAGEGTAARLARAQEAAPALQQRFEQVQRRTGGLAEIQAREESQNKTLRNLIRQREEQEKIVRAIKGKREAEVLGPTLERIKFAARFTGAGALLAPTGALGPSAQKERELSATKKIADLNKEIEAQGKRAVSISEKEANNQREFLAARGELERNTATIQAEQLQLVQDQKQATADTARSLEKNVTSQLKAVDAARQLLEVRKKETGELENQRKSQEQQFGLLTRREQRRQTRLAEKLAAGEKLSLQQLRDVRGVAIGALRDPFLARLRERGGERLETLERLQQLPRGIQAAEAREQAAMEAVQREIKVSGELITKIELKITATPAEFEEAFSEVIQPGIERLKESIEGAVQLTLEGETKDTISNSTTRETNL